MPATIDPKDRVKALDTMRKADSRLNKALSETYSIDTKGLTGPEQFEALAVRDHIRRALNTLNGLMVSTISPPIAPTGLITKGKAPTGFKTPKGFKTVTLKMEENTTWPTRLEGVSKPRNPAGVPAAAYINDPTVDYVKLHTMLGCHGCKRALRQYLNKGPACTVRSHDGKTDPDGKCKDHQAT